MSPVLKAGPVSRARYEALRILVRVEQDRAFADIALEHALEEAELDPRDAGLCTEIVYGTPEFALPTLDALLARHRVVAVVTRPDRPSGRGQRLTAPPVKRRAEATGIPVLQPARLRDPEWPERLARFDAEVAVVVAFGQILPKAVLGVPARGSINVHASLLPRYRGAAPVAWAIIRGETETGITTFRMDPGMDTGDILLQEATPIGLEETAGELGARLADLGARVLLGTLDRLDTLAATPQDHAAATLAP